MNLLQLEHFPILHTERLLLRSLQLSDANEIYALRSDDDINKYIERSKAKTLEDAEQFIRLILDKVAARETLLWAIQLKEQDALAGTFLLWNIDKEKNEAEIGYELLPQYHGKGIVQEAMKTVLVFAFDQLKFASIVAIVHKENIASLKVLQRSRFECMAVLEENMLKYELRATNFGIPVKK